MEDLKYRPCDDIVMKKNFQEGFAPVLVVVLGVLIILVIFFVYKAGGNRISANFPGSQAAYDTDTRSGSQLGTQPIAQGSICSSSEQNCKLSGGRWAGSCLQYNSDRTRCLIEGSGSFQPHFIRKSDILMVA